MHTQPRYIQRARPAAGRGASHRQLTAVLNFGVLRMERNALQKKAIATTFQFVCASSSITTARVTHTQTQRYRAKRHTIQTFLRACLTPFEGKKTTTQHSTHCEASPQFNRCHQEDAHSNTRVESRRLSPHHHVQPPWETYPAAQRLPSSSTKLPRGCFYAIAAAES